MLEGKKLAAVLLCCSLLPGCAVLEGKRSPNVGNEASMPKSSGPESDTLAWLAAYRVLSNTSVDEQRKEYLAAQAAASKDYSDGNRLRLALALSLPGVPWRDDNKLMATLEAPPSLFRLPYSPLHQLVFVLYKQAQERQNIRDELRRRENELLEEQKRLRDEQKQNDAELLEERRQNEELQMKLDALRRIDQDIKHRKQGLESTP